MRSFIRGFVAAVRVGLRRPASAVACVGGFVAGLGFARGGGAIGTTGDENIVGGLLAVAALGELPTELLAFGGRCGLGARPPVEAVGWAAARSLFPLVGVAAAAAATSGGLPLDSGSLAAVAAAIVATACVQAAVHAGGARGSEPATAALLVAAAAAGAAWAGLPRAGIAVGWAAAALASGYWSWITTASERLTCSRGRGRTVWLWPLPSQGRLRPTMTAAVMLLGIAGMAFWLVPQPPLEKRYAAVAAAVFIAVAVPQMTLADGVLDRSGWMAVFRPTARSFPIGSSWPPAGRIAIGHAALFAWPLVVAGVLTIRLPGAAAAMATAAAVLLLPAAAAGAMAAWMGRLGIAAETTLATVLVVFAAACIWSGPFWAESARFFPI